jgi:ATP-dependent exoDNAse (exonuclease V) beta subunit
VKHKIVYESPYEYGVFSSEDRKGARFYDCNGEKLPSVTTILSGTKEGDFLKKWIERVGEEEAERIRSEAATRGTYMHDILEKQIVNGGIWEYKPENAEQKRALKMAGTIMDQGFPNISQVYGCEVSLYYPDKYAGKTDVIGVHDDELAIIDFKQTNRPKRRQWVWDYFQQLAAYSLAHNELYGTDIEKGVIMMCSVDCLYQEFVLEGDEFKRAADAWMERVEKFSLLPKGEEAQETQ